MAPARFVFFEIRRVQLLQVPMGGRIRLSSRKTGVQTGGCGAWRTSGAWTGSTRSGVCGIRLA